MQKLTSLMIIMGGILDAKFLYKENLFSCAITSILSMAEATESKDVPFNRIVHFLVCNKWCALLN